MKPSKNSSPAGMMPQVEVKFNISEQVIAHKLLNAFVLIL